jgi:hypothetical protein
MFLTPRAAAPKRSACSPIRFRSRHERWATTSIPASSCTILAAATGCILSLARAPSEMSMASTPRSFRRRAASTTEVMSLPRGRSTSTVTAKPARILCAKPETGLLAISLRSTFLAASACLRVVLPLTLKLLSATERACTWAGVVPQQPPMRRAPASASLAPYLAKWLTSRV